MTSDFIMQHSMLVFLLNQQVKYTKSFRYSSISETYWEITLMWWIEHLSQSLHSIKETSPYSFGNFRKLSLCNCFMPI